MCLRLLIIFVSSGCTRNPPPDRIAHRQCGVSLVQDRYTAFSRGFSWLLRCREIRRPRVIRAAQALGGSRACAPCRRCGRPRFGSGGRRRTACDGRGSRPARPGSRPWPPATESAITPLPFSLSSAAVGSSARITEGEPASARAIETRCFSPPLSLLGVALARCDRPTCCSAFAASAGRLRRRGAAQVERQHDVLGGGQRRHQVVGLEHEAHVLAAQIGKLLGRHPGRRVPRDA